MQALNLTKLDPIYQRLTSNIPDEFYTSGQWMTERKGGSDVANGTETIAVQQSNGKYLLYGYKWFSSATDADVTFTLARIVDSDGQTISVSNRKGVFRIFSISGTRRSSSSLSGPKILLESGILLLGFGPLNFNSAC